MAAPGGAAGPAVEAESAAAGGGRQRALGAYSPVDYMSITSFPRLPEEEAGGAAEGGLRARKEEDAFLGEQDTGEGRRPGPACSRPPRRPPTPRRARAARSTRHPPTSPPARSLAASPGSLPSPPAFPSELRAARPSHGDPRALGAAARCRLAARAERIGVGDAIKPRLRLIHFTARIHISAFPTANSWCCSSCLPRPCAPGGLSGTFLALVLYTAHRSLLGSHRLIFPSPCRAPHWSCWAMPRVAGTGTALEVGVSSRYKDFGKELALLPARCMILIKPGVPFILEKTFCLFLFCCFLVNSPEYFFFLLHVMFPQAT